MAARRLRGELRYTLNRQKAGSGGMVRMRTTIAELILCGFVARI